MPPLDAKFDVVGCEYNGSPARGPFGEQVAQHLPGILVQPGLWLIQQQYVRLMQDSPGDGRASLHSVGQRAHPVIGTEGQPHAFEDCGYTGLPVPYAVEAGVVVQVLPRRQVIVEKAAMCNYSDTPPGLCRVAAQVVAGNAHRAGVWADAGGEDAEESSLARAVGPEQRQGLSPVNRHVEVPEHRPLPVALFQPLSQDGVVGFLDGQVTVFALAEIE